MAIGRRRSRANGSVLAHGHLPHVLAARWVGLPAATGAVVALNTASASLPGKKRDTSAIISWNLVSANGRSC